MLQIDRRQGSAELVAPLEAKGLDILETTLEFGDVAFGGRGEHGVAVSIGIEVKQLSELVASMRSGRLEGHQLLGMREATPGESPLYDFAYLYVIGEVLYDDRNLLLERKYRRGQSSLEPMHGSMDAFEFLKRIEVLQLRGGLNTRYFKDQAKLVDGIEILYRTWTDKDLDKHTSHLAIYNPPPLLPISAERSVFATLPGVGFKLSGLVAAHFDNNIYNAFTAPVSEWADIEGIGTGKATTIHQFIRGRK
jgi:ERCC4-type nuclease